MGMHINGFAEYRFCGEWTFISELLFIPRPHLYYKLFGQHDAIEGVTPVAPNRGLPDERSDRGDEWVERQTHLNPVADSMYLSGFGHSHMTMDEFPSEERDAYEGSEDSWGAVLEMLEPYESEYGSENVRLVVSFEH